MLAESRKRQKWSTDPRNTAWCNDDSRYGQKMLEKMGWKRGRGLGAEEKGSTKIIPTLVKQNSHGVGFTQAHENNWVAHQDDFAKLLEDLNKNNSSDGDVNNHKSSVCSLEENSKVQKRIHYKKFAKGKDISGYKSEDMAAIFGQVSQVTEVVKEEIIETEITVTEKLHDKSNTTTSEYSVQQYFKMRMEKLNVKSKEPVTEESTVQEKVKVKKIKKDKKKLKSHKKDKEEESNSKKIKKRKMSKNTQLSDDNTNNSDNEIKKKKKKK